MKLFLLTKFEHFKISNKDPDSGCHLPCEPVYVCPAFSQSDCDLTGGIAVAAGPCTICQYQPGEATDDAVCEACGVSGRLAKQRHR